MSQQDLSLDSIQQTPFFPETQNRVEIEKIAPERIIHDANGKFAPGNCANPGGRPKSKHITEAYKSILEEEGADKYARVITEIALCEASKDSDRIQAIQEMTDRVEGRATQRVDMRGIVVMMPATADLEALDSWAGDEE